MSNGPTVRDIIMFLEMYFPATASFQTALLALCTLVTFHQNQLREPRQPQNTAWMRAIAQVMTDSLGSITDIVQDGWMDQDEIKDCTDNLARDAESLFSLLELGPNLDFLHVRSHTILCTTFQDCVLCQGQARTLRRRDKLTEVSLLNKDLKWVKATLVVGHCISCGADYYPDKIVISSSEHTGTRQQKLLTCGMH